MARHILTPEDIKKSKTPEAIEKARLTRNKTYTDRALKNQVLEGVAQKLTATDGKKDPYHMRFMEKFLSVAMNNPTSQAGVMVASAIINKELLDTLDETHEKNIARDLDFQRFRVQKRLFREQRMLLLDTHTKRKLAACCSRRAGKTDLAATLLNYISVTPNSPMFYINLTFKNAINQLCDLVIDIADSTGVRIKEKSKTKGIIYFENGSSLQFGGNSDNAEADKLRGYKARLVIIDEAGHQRNMKYLVEDVITPLLTDYEDSVLLLTGTPPRIPKTYFEKCLNSREYTSYHWSMLDNPFIPDPEQAIADICTAKGLTPDSPLIRREFLGEIYYDTEAMIFKGYNTYEGNGEVMIHGTRYTPPSDFTPNKIYIGVDFGFRDYNSIINLAIDTTKQISYVVYEAKFNKSTVTKIVECIQEGVQVARGFLIINPLANPNDIMILCDNNESSIAYELVVTYKLNANKAYKYDKSMALEQLSEETRIAKLFVPKDGVLSDEFDQLVYKRGENDEILTEVDDELFHGEATDALLYASRSMFVDYGREGHKHGKGFNNDTN